MNKDIKEALFPVIRRGLGLSAEDLPLPTEVCRSLLRFGEGQSILPIIYKGLEKMDAPRECLDEFREENFGCIYDFMNRDLAIKQISSLLDSEKIHYILLKGAVLRHLYPSPELRTSCDLDILVKEDDLDRACAAVERGTDFKYRRRSYHNLILEGPEIVLELHFSIRENEEKLDTLLSRAWEYAVPCKGGSGFCFTPEYQIFYITAHMAHHLLHGGIGIRPFIDLWLLNNRTAFDEQKVRHMCESCGILTFYEESMRLSRVWLEGTGHTETSEMFEGICLSGGVLGSDKFRNAARQREKRGVSYIAGRIFPPPYEVRELYKDDDGREHSLPYYYAKRLLSWTGKERRERLGRQIKTILTSDGDYIEDAGELLNRLKL